MNIAFKALFMINKKKKECWWEDKWIQKKTRDDKRWYLKTWLSENSKPFKKLLIRRDVERLSFTPNDWSLLFVKQECIVPRDSGTFTEKKFQSDIKI